MTKGKSFFFINKIDNIIEIISLTREIIRYIFAIEKGHKDAKSQRQKDRNTLRP